MTFHRTPLSNEMSCRLEGLFSLYLIRNSQSYVAAVLLNLLLHLCCWRLVAQCLDKAFLAMTIMMLILLLDSWTIQIVSIYNLCIMPFLKFEAVDEVMIRSLITKFFFIW